MMTLRQAAAELGVSASTLRRQALIGHLDARKIGVQWLVGPAAIERYRRERLGQNNGRAGFEKIRALG